VRTSHHGGRERAVTVYRETGPRVPLVRRYAPLVAAAAAWAAATVVVGTVVEQRLDGADLGLALLVSGTLLWVVLGLPALAARWVLREVRERAGAVPVTGTVVFRGEYDPRRNVDDDRRLEYYLAIDDGTSSRVPAYRTSHRVVTRTTEGDVVRAAVTRTRPRILHLAVLSRT
jgi:hypothetical protein